MYRKIYNDLLAWKESTSRKPLMLYGARQVGKTYILKEFGKNEFQNMVYLNCYKNSAIKELFSGNVNIPRILLGLSAISGEKITPGKTLIFLDEVQDVPEVVASLKYFQEEANEIFIAVAGSLLGVINMEGNSFPVGKVDILHIYPMTFIEFLIALNENIKAELLTSSSDHVLINSISAEFTDLLRQYYFVGGMPEAVKEYCKSKDLITVRNIQTNIINAYEADIAKHAGRDTQKARMVFQSIPSQLAKENKKFIFGALKKGARAAEFENAIQWLVDAGLVYKVNRINKMELPLKFYIEKDVFKLFLLDIGLLGALAEVPPSLILINDNIFSEYKGAFTENYVLEQAVTIPDNVITYFSKNNSTIEIDFIIQSGIQLLPVEVKAETNVKSKSLRQLITVDNISKNLHGYRFSMNGFQDQSWMSNIPLYAVEPFLQHSSRPTTATVSSKKE